MPETRDINLDFSFANFFLIDYSDFETPVSLKTEQGAKEPGLSVAGHMLSLHKVPSSRLTPNFQRYLNR